MTTIRGRLLRGGAWAFAGKFGSALSGIVVNALLARLLTPEEMGAFFLTFSLISVAAVVAQLGLNQAVVRLVAESIGTEKFGRAAKAVRLTFRIGAVGALLVAGLLALGAGDLLAREVFDSELMAGVIGIAAVWVVVMAFQDLLAESFRGFHDIRLAAIFRGLVASVLSAILFAGLWILQGHAALSDVFILAIASGITSNLVACALLRGKLKSLNGESDLQGKDILRIAWPLWITSFMLYALTQADIWILGAYRSPQEVAIYGAAARIMVIVAVPALIMYSVLSPMIAELYAQERKKELERLLRASTSVATILACMILAGFAFFGEFVLSLVFGDFYREANTVLVILAFGQLISVLAGPCGLVLMMTGHQTTMMVITTACGLIAVISILWLVQSYGTIGVAVGVSIVMTLQSVLLLLATKATTSIWTHAGPKAFLAELRLFQIRP